MAPVIRKLLISENDKIIPIICKHLNNNMLFKMSLIFKESNILNIIFNDDAFKNNERIYRLLVVLLKSLVSDYSNDKKYDLITNTYSGINSFTTAKNASSNSNIATTENFNLDILIDFFNANNHRSEIMIVTALLHQARFDLLNKKLQVLLKANPFSWGGYAKSFISKPNDQEQNDKAMIKTLQDGIYKIQGDYLEVVKNADDTDLMNLRGNTTLMTIEESKMEDGYTVKQTIEKTNTSVFGYVCG